MKTAIGSPIGTVSPAAARVSSRTPSSSASRSTIAFSVSTLATTSPRVTLAPGATVHSTMDASVESAEMPGMRSTVATSPRP